MEQQEATKRSFEQSLGELEGIVGKLESGNIPLEDMVALYERGTAIGKECMAMLEGYQARINTLTAREDTKDEV